MSKARSLDTDYRFGYLDENQRASKFKWRIVPLLLCLLFLSGSWFFLTEKIIFGDNYISETYDHVGWRTNEGETPTHGAWDLEAHIWKSEYILEHWPHVLWNPYWYLGMPLFKYYQAGFYVVHVGVIKIFGLHPAYAANMIIIVGLLLAVFATFLLCLRISGRYILSAMLSFFLLSNTFLTLRSFGWEPITVVFLWLFPLSLLVFLRQPLRPFRIWMIVVLTASYLAHPLIWFALCMTLGLYLFVISVSASRARTQGIAHHNVLTQYVALVISSLLLGGFQSAAQFTYSQVTSGAHMGVSYLPFYHVMHNVLPVSEFFFSFGNLRGPGPIVLLAFILLFVLVALAVKRPKSNSTADSSTPLVVHYAMSFALSVVLVVMVVFYYFAALNIFPMNILSSVQYHRMIPEFMIISAALIASLYTLARTRAIKILYYGAIVACLLASVVVMFGVQADWQTIDNLDDKPEMIFEDVPGRISMPYTEQSLAVRNSFTSQHQVYGYYEQGITNSYADEMFSVSSGFHTAEHTILYLQAAGVTRLYVNKANTIRNEQVRNQLSGDLLYVDANERYSYFHIPIRDPSLAQAVPISEVEQVLSLEPGCRVMFQETYCGSVGQEFVARDLLEQQYLRAYVNMLERDYEATAEFIMDNPDNYRIVVRDATEDTAVVIKMTDDRSWQATVDGQRVEIRTIGPDYMVVHPNRFGEYTIHLKYRLNIEHIVGGVLSIITFFVLLGFFFFRRRIPRTYENERGDLFVENKEVAK